VSEAQPGRLKPSTRINAGLLMLIVGFACTAFSMLIPGIIGFGVTLAFPVGLILLLTGVFQLLRGLRERHS
jgi:hypothetical protein